MKKQGIEFVIKRAAGISPKVRGRRRLKGRGGGFSLVELLISVAILGILAAAAMTLYRKPRQTSGLRNMAQEMEMTAISVKSCFEARGEFGLCDTPAKAKVSHIRGISKISVPDTAAADNSRLCLQFVRKVAGEEYKTCLSLKFGDRGYGRYYSHQFNKKLCHEETPNPCSGTACGCAVGAISGACKVMPVPCSADADCGTALAGTSVKCLYGTANAAAGGACKAGDATCNP